MDITKLIRIKINIQY